MYLISACLVGINCRYNGKSTFNFILKKLIEDGKAIAVCPEVLAGLTTPRESCEIKKNMKGTFVVSKSGTDYSKVFHNAAIETLNLCKTHDISTAILQSRSPSCGYGTIYNGEFNGKLIQGNGITADLLHKNGIKILTDENWSDELIENELSDY